MAGMLWLGRGVWQGWRDTEKVQITCRVISHQGPQFKRLKAVITCVANTVVTTSAGCVLKNGNVIILLLVDTSSEVSVYHCCVYMLC